jgi:hypothetical protein
VRVQQLARHRRQRQWEYWIEEGDPDVERLNELGAQGWELTETIGVKLIFKRKKRPDEPPPPEGGAGVREPRRPTPLSGPAATRKPPPDAA